MDTTLLDTPDGKLRLRRDGGNVVARGVRYAAPPVGERRFRPPEPVAPWTGERDALEFGPIAHQPPSFMTGAKALPASEDCLWLNVWAPEGADGAPVMVWFHGGGFTTGMASIPWYDGRRLAERGAVAVTLNYRLGPLGFLHLASLGGDAWEGAANLGLLDQAMALDWVARNIAAFGGDPERVTIFGESAGGMSVGTHLALPASAGRFHRAVAQSGAASHVHDADGGERVARAVLDALGVDPGNLSALRALPAEAFVEVQAGLQIPDARFLPLPFRPTVDGTTLPVTPLDGLAPGVPLLCGTNLEEMQLYTVLGALGGDRPGLDEARLRRRVERAAAERSVEVEPDEIIATYRRRLGADADPAAVFSAIATDLVFRIPAIEMAERRSADADSFMYLFTHRSTAFDGALGSGHSVEIPFVFDSLGHRSTEFMLGPITDERRRLADRMSAAWFAFADRGDPSTDELPWPRYDADRRATVRLDTDPGVVEDPQRDERRIWTG
jgi:para-nitrobenzyl esterase